MGGKAVIGPLLSYGIPMNWASDPGTKRVSHGAADRLCYGAFFPCAFCTLSTTFHDARSAVICCGVRLS